MSRGRLLAICLGGLCVLALGVRLALPSLLRDALLDVASAATGRTASLEDLSLGLLAGQLDLSGLALSGDEAPVLELDEASLRLSWLGLLRRQVHLTALTLSGARLRLGADEPFVREDPEAVEEPAAESDESAAAWSVLVEGVRLRDFALAFGDGSQVTHLGLAGFDLAFLRIDEEGLSLGGIDVDRPVLQTAGVAEPPASVAEGAPAEPFRVGAFVDDLPGSRVEGLHLRDGDVTFEIAGGPVEAQLELDVDALELRRGGETRLSLRTQVAGGSVALEGRVVLDPLSCEATLRWSDIEVARLQPVVSGVQLDQGSTSAELEIALSVTESQGTEGLSAAVKGELAVLNTRLETSGSTVLGWESLLVDIRDIRWSQSAPAASNLVVALEAVRLSAPDVQWTAAPPAGEADPPPAVDEAAEAMPIDVAVDLLQIVGGRVLARDTGVTPAFEGRGRFQASAEAIRWPQQDIERLSLSVTGEHGESVSVSGRLQGGEGEISVDAESIALARFDGYASTHAGVRIEDGQLFWRGRVARDEASTALEGKLVFVDLDLEDTKGRLNEMLGVDVIGVPFDAAVVILRDADGKIELPIEARVDAGGRTRVSVASIVANALQQAVLTSMTTPLATMRLVQRLAFDAGDVALPQIAFAPGSSTPGAAAAERFDALVELLQARDDVTLLLSGRASESEARLLGVPESESAVTLARLGRQRAEAAAGVLKEKLGADADRVQIEAPEEGSPGLRLSLRKR